MSARENHGVGGDLSGVLGKVGASGGSCGLLNVWWTIWLQFSAKRGSKMRKMDQVKTNLAASCAQESPGWYQDSQLASNMRLVHEFVKPPSDEVRLYPRTNRCEPGTMQRAQPSVVQGEIPFHSMPFSNPDDGHRSIENEKITGRGVNFETLQRLDE
jgi:hypothetical protein